MKPPVLLALFAPLAFVLALAACSTHDADVAAIRADEAQWLKDYNSRDQERIASHYAADAVVMNPGGPAVHGRDGARKPQPPDPNFSLAMEIERIEVSGDVGYVLGPYTMTRTDRTTTQKMIEKGQLPHGLQEAAGSHLEGVRRHGDRGNAVTGVARMMPIPGARVHIY